MTTGPLVVVLGLGTRTICPLVPTDMAPGRSIAKGEGEGYWILKRGEGKSVNQLHMEGRQLGVTESMEAGASFFLKPEGSAKVNHRRHDHTPLGHLS